MKQTRYEVIDWMGEPSNIYLTNNIHEAREIAANAASLGFNPSTTFIWDRLLTKQAAA